MNETLFLLDGNSLFYRAYYAVSHLSNSRGEPTNAVYGFARMYASIVEQYNPERVVVAFDTKGPTFRKEQYAQYKATRKPMPEDLVPQVDLIKELLDQLGVTRIELPGYEADDIIGTVATQGEKLGRNVFIVTGDKDALQLISDKTTVLLTKRGIQELDTVDEDRLQQLYGLRPQQIVDLKALMGDASDNIPGVPGVGEKTAQRLLASFPSLEDIYANLHQVKGKLKETLEKHEAEAQMSKELATIDCQVPIAVDWDHPPTADENGVKQLLQRLEFRDLAGKLLRSQSDSSKEAVTVLKAHEAKEQFCQRIQQAEQIILDATDGITVGVGETVYQVDASSAPDCLLQLEQALGEKATVVCHDVKHLYRAFCEQTSLPVSMDTCLAAYLLEPGAPVDLTSLAARWGYGYRDESITSPGERIECVRYVAPKLEEKLRDAKLWELHNTLELPTAHVLSKMESKGILVDQKHLRQLSLEMGGTLATLTKEIHRLAGESFNINSPKQLGKILFDKLGLPIIKRTKTGPSTDASVLEKLSSHEIVAKLLSYRQIAKLKSTYTDAIADLVSAETGRLHTTFNQSITATGRLSSTNPNLQNIPIRTEEGRRIRQAFIAKPKYVLLKADYSQIELRVLAHVSEDEKLIAAFNSGEDIHRRTAAEILQIPLESVSDEQRSSAKAVNFGIIYGISSFGLARDTNMTKAQAQKYIDQYLQRYPKVKEYMQRIIAVAREQGYVTTLLGRRRYLPDINSKNNLKSSFAERMALNTPIQGTAADIIKLAMVEVDKRLSETKIAADLLLQVHDELVLEVEKDSVAQVAKLVKQSMEQVMQLKVQLETEVSVGVNWKDVQPYSEALR